MDKSYLDQFIQPVVDRDINDIILIRSLLDKGYSNFTDEEKELWDSDLKGALNISDLNRIENNIYVLSKCLDIEADKITYKETDIPQNENFLRIYNNLNKIKDNLLTITHENLPNIPDLPYNTYEKYNDIESLIYYMYDIINNISN